jgi:hypothetical protein
MKDFCIQKIINLDKSIFSLKLLKDKRLAAANEFKTLNIYDLKSYKPDIIISGIFPGFITNINQLKNENLIVSSDEVVKIIKITKNTFNIIQSLILTGGVFDGTFGLGGIKVIKDKIIELNNEDLAILIKSNNLIQLWKKEKDKYLKYDNLIDKGKEISEIFEIKPNIILSDNYNYKHLVIWNVENKQKITILKGINVNDVISDNKTCFINENSIAYCGNSNLYIIEINNFYINQKIEINKEYLISICLFSKNILFIGGNKGKLYQFEIEGKNITLKDKNDLKFEKEISSIVKLDENTFAFGCCANQLFFMKKNIED